MEIDIYSPEKEGYEVKHCFDGWRVAYLRYAEKFDDITYLERHLERMKFLFCCKDNSEYVRN